MPRHGDMMEGLPLQFLLGAASQWGISSHIAKDWFDAEQARNQHKENKTKQIQTQITVPIVGYRINT